MAWTSPRTWVVSELGTASFMNTYLRDNLNWLYSGDASWITPTFSNGWSSAQNASYKKVGNVVVMRGYVTGGTLSATIFTLPAGYRPLYELLFATAATQITTGWADLRVRSDGTVLINSLMGCTWGGLFGVQFSAEQ